MERLFVYVLFIPDKVSYHSFNYKLHFKHFIYIYNQRNYSNLFRTIRRRIPSFKTHSYVTRTRIIEFERVKISDKYKRYRIKVSNVERMALCKGGNGRYED